MVLNMILCFILIISVLNLIKEVWRFSTSFAKGTKYMSSSWRTALTFASIASIITIAIFGF